MLVGGDAQVAERPLVPVLDPGAADHLRADETGAEAPPLAAERLHADARHRRQDDARRDLDVPDPPALAEVDLHTAHGWYSRVLTASEAAATIPARVGASVAGFFYGHGSGGRVEGSHPHA